MPKAGRGTLVVLAILALTVAPGSAEYKRAGWQANLATYYHSVDGVVTIVDERTLVVEHFDYVVPAPAVYFYLGTELSQSAFIAGRPIGPQILRDYHDEVLLLELPEGETLDGYTAISVWCEDVYVDFGSGMFAAPGDLFEPGDMNCDGTVDTFDIDGFILAFSGQAAYDTQFPDCDWFNADMNGDGAVDTFDIDQFIERLTGTTP